VVEGKNTRVTFRHFCLSTVTLIRKNRQRYIIIFGHLPQTSRITTSVYTRLKGVCSSVVERPLRMREARGSIPRRSKLFGRYQCKFFDHYFFRLFCAHQNCLFRWAYVIGSSLASWNSLSRFMFPPTSRTAACVASAADTAAAIAANTILM
jgi:hypothetical protein